MYCVNKYNLGEAIASTCTFVEADTGDPLDPGAVFATVKRPGGAEETFQYGVDSEITRTGVGAYRYVVNANCPGDWKVRWFSTGPVQAASVRKFHVMSAWDTETDCSCA